MKLDKTTETLLTFLSVLIILITAWYVEKIFSDNRVNHELYMEFSLTGARLSDEVYASMSKSKEWKNKDSVGAQYDFTIKNNSDETLVNWLATVPVPEGTIIDSIWNVDARITDGKLTMIPDATHSSIAKNDEITFGMVLLTKDAYFPTTIYFSGFPSASDKGTVFRKIIILLIVVWFILFIGFFVTKFNLRNYRQKQKNDVKIILQSMNTFISFIDAKDPYTRGHSRRVAMYAAEIAKRMHLSEDEVQNIYYAGLLHDAGKISVPDAVLNKPGVLTEEERMQIQDHTVAGGKMLKQLSSLRGIRETALYHHERYDGTGYPEGLKGESIPLYARIVGVADSYDAMSSNRVYRRHLNKDEIIEEIQQGSGTQFDPVIVSFMVDMINDGYVNVVKMETAENEEDSRDFHLTEDDIPGVYMGF